MGSEAWPVVRRAAVPFLAGAAAAVAVLNGLYATAMLGLLVALWSAALIHQALSRKAAPGVPIAVPAPSGDTDGRRRLSLYLDLSPAPLVALDTDDRLSAINRAARRLLAAEDLVEAPPADLVEAIASTAPGRSATVRIAAGGGDHAFAILTADLESGDRAVRVAALVDIDADLKAAAAATLRDLLQVLSHEITNTLTPIASLSASAAAMLAEPGADLPAVRDAVATVARRTQGLQCFGKAYRDLARLPPPTIDRVDLGRLIADLAQLFASRWPGATLTLTLPPALVPIAADGDQLAQALWALLQNAAEASNRVTLHIAQQGAKTTFGISDLGPGIAAADAEAIFRPFFTTKPEGSGVGLALARQIFRGQGGDLVLKQRNPGMTTFEGMVPTGQAYVIGSS